MATHHHTHLCQSPLQPLQLPDLCLQVGHASQRPLPFRPNPLCKLLPLRRTVHRRLHVALPALLRLLVLLHGICQLGGGVARQRSHGVGVLLRRGLVLGVQSDRRRLCGRQGLLHRCQLGAGLLQGSFHHRVVGVQLRQLPCTRTSPWGVHKQHHNTFQLVHVGGLARRVLFCVCQRPAHRPHLVLQRLQRRVPVLDLHLQRLALRLGLRSGLLRGLQRGCSGLGGLLVGETRVRHGLVGRRHLFLQLFDLGQAGLRRVQGLGGHCKLRGQVGVGSNLLLGLVLEGVVGGGQCREVVVQCLHALCRLLVL